MQQKWHGSLSTPQTSQDMARDKEKPHLDVVLDNQYLVLKTTGSDVESTTLSGHVMLFLTEATSIKEITLQFKGKAKIPVQALDSIINSNNVSSSVICSHDWSFLEGDKKHSHTLKAGRHCFPFHLEISDSLPSSLFTPVLGGASVAYTLRALATRPGFSHNLQAVAPVYIIRSITREALEFQQTLDIENTWPDKLMYAIMLPHKAWAAGDTLTTIVKLSPLAKGIFVQSIVSSITETTKICSKSSHENTRVVASVRHEIIDRKAVEIDLHPPSCAAAGSSGASGTTIAHLTRSPPNSRPPSPHSGPSSLHRHSHHSHQHHQHHHPLPTQQEEEEEGLGLDNGDVVTYINLSIPPSSAYPFFFSAFPESLHTHGPSSSHSQPPASPGAFFSFTNTNHNTASPTTTPPRSTSPMHQHVPLPLPANSVVPHPTSPPVCPLSAITPSHALEPIIISHRIKWSIYIRNKDGHVSELRCSLPIKILDGVLLDESRAFTMRSRRLLLRASGLGSVLSRGGGEGSEDEDEAEATEDNIEMDRELPSYPAHVRDRVANMYLPEAVTIRVSNPWVGRIGMADAASESAGGALSSPELSRQGESGIITPPTGVVSPSDQPASADRSPAPHTQNHSRASRSGHNTPPIQPSQVHMMSHLPHAPASEENAPLDWINSELLLGLSLDEEALRRIGGIPSAGGQQQLESQSQSHQQHQTHSHSRQQSRTPRWGSRVGSRAGSRAASPERNTLPSATTTKNNDNTSSSIPEGTTGSNCGSPCSAASASPMPASSSSSGIGFASPFQHLFKATMKPFSALAGHHGHGLRPTHPRSRSTTSLMGLHSMHTAGTVSDLASGSASGQPIALNPETSEINAPPSGLSLTRPLSDAGLTSSPTPSPAPQSGTNDFISTSTSTSSSSQSLSEIATANTSQILAPLPSPLSDPILESTPAYTMSASSPLTHIHDLEYPSSRLYRAFTVVPDYSIASRGFIGGGVPPLTSMRGLPSYEEAEAQQRAREAETLRERETEIQNQTQIQQLPIPNQDQTSIHTRTQAQAQNQVITSTMKMKERGSISEPDLAGRFGYALRFESGTQNGTAIEVGTHSVHRDTSSVIGIMQQLKDEDEDEDDTGDADAIQIRTKKARP